MNLYLASTDYCDFQYVRRIIKTEHLTIENIDVLKIRTDIPIDGQKYGQVNHDIDVFYLTNKYNNKDLINLNSFPIAIAVYITKISSHTTPNYFNEMLNIAWAELFDNKEEAQKSVELWLK